MKKGRNALLKEITIHCYITRFHVIIILMLKNKAIAKTYNFFIKKKCPKALISNVVYFSSNISLIVSNVVFSIPIVLMR